MYLSDNLPRRQLVIDTQTPATEIIVVDSDGVIQAQGVSKLDQSIPVALYKVRYRIGDRVVDQLIDLEPGDGPYQPTVPPLPILSAAPLPDSEADANSAQFAEQLVARPCGERTLPASLFVFISAIMDSALDPNDVPEKPGAGISIHKFSGELVGDLETAETQHGCCGLTVRVAPGNYILRVRIPQGKPVEQTLVAVAGWQLQYYARLVKKEIAEADRSSTSPQFAWQLEIGRSGVLLLQEPVTHTPGNSVMKWTAAARQALGAGRSKVAPDKEMMDALLREKFKNPMLGIYAGHLLAMQKDSSGEVLNKDLLREVIVNLNSLVGDHPDVSSLLIALKDPRADSLTFEVPPMLRRSWALILDAGTVEKDLRPPRSYAAIIGASLWGNGAWLAWRMPEPMEGESPSPDFLQLLYKQALSGQLTNSAGRLAQTLTPTESLLARYFEAAANQVSQARTFTDQDDQRTWYSAVTPLIRAVSNSALQESTKNEITPLNLIKMTGLPYSTIVDAAAGLASKLGVIPNSSIFSTVLGALKFK